MLFGCHTVNNSFNSVTQGVSAAGVEELSGDSSLDKLVSEGALVIDLADINTAWTKKSTHQVLVLKDKVWQGYNYEKSLSPKSPESVFLNPSAINIATCDSLLQYIAKKVIWNQKNEGEKNGCPNNLTGCPIADANTLLLRMIWGQKMTTVSYYAPFYKEQCCPGWEERKNFNGLVELMNRALITKSGAVY